MKGVIRTEIPGLKLIGRGKVRDIYEYDGTLLLVATDRISAFDAVLPTPIPDKGKILTQISRFWFEKVGNISAHHLITTALPDVLVLQSQRSILKGRTMIVRRANVLPVEFVVRAYIFGTAYEEYVEHGTACGIVLPAGIRLAGRLPFPIFDPFHKEQEWTRHKHYSRTSRENSGEAGFQRNRTKNHVYV